LPFRRNGNPVVGVEPNAEMRAAGDRLLAGYPRFRRLPGTAEATGLPDGAVDYVVAGQAFHWFDRPAARREFVRVLRPGGWVVLLWNTRRTDATPFLRAYEAFLREHGTDYREVTHENLGPGVFAGFYGPGGYTKRVLDNEQRFDLAGLRGRLLSSSYVPGVGHPGYEPMLRALEGLFAQYQSGGTVVVEYDTEVYFGRLI
jgi:SAM-dependent methyltransferase